MIGGHSSAARTWARRAASIPGYFVAAAVLLGAAPLWATATLAVDILRGDLARAPRLRALCFFLLYLACEVAGTSAAGLIWLGTLGGIVGGPERFARMNYALQRAWSSALFRGSFSVFSMKLQVEGIERVGRGPMLLFVRHSSTADTVLAAALVANPLELRLRYVIKQELLWDPCLDVVGGRLPNAFIGRRGEDVAAIAELGKDLDESSGVLIYPEGTRFSAKKLAAGIERLRARGRDDLADLASTYRTVLPPRSAGPLALIEAAPNAAVVFLEHQGFEGAATFADFYRGGLIGKTVQVRLRRFGPDAIPQEGRDIWLYERWKELDDWLSDSPPTDGMAPAQTWESATMNSTGAGTDSR